MFQHGICTCASVCVAGSNDIVCMMSLRVQVETPQSIITSQEIRSMCYTGIGVQSHRPLSPQWSRRHGERPHTRHSLFHSFKQCAPVEYVPEYTLRSWSHRHFSPWSGVFMVPVSFSFLVLCFPCHSRFSQNPNKNTGQVRSQGRGSPRPGPKT